MDICTNCKKEIPENIIDECFEVDDECICTECLRRGWRTKKIILKINEDLRIDNKWRCRVIMAIAMGCPGKTVKVSARRLAMIAPQDILKTWEDPQKTETCFQYVVRG